MNPMAPIVLSAMLAWAPPKTDGDRLRYESIAVDIDAVVSDQAEEPIAPGPEGRVRTALLLASTAYDESYYRADVDDGRARGDQGHSVCVMQIWVERTRDGWTADELIHNRQKCVRTALHIIRGSMAWCHQLTGGDRLGGYTHGKCVAPNRLGRGRWGRAFAWPLPALPVPDAAPHSSVFTPSTTRTKES